MTERADLLSALRAAAVALPDVTELNLGGETTWARAGRQFAVLRDVGADLRVGSAIAVAAVRTPNTIPSMQGPAWISFAPETLDGSARDRLAAWFAAAWRRAAG